MTGTPESSETIDSKVNDTKINGVDRWAAILGEVALGVCDDIGAAAGKYYDAAKQYGTKGVEAAKKAAETVWEESDVVRDFIKTAYVNMGEGAAKVKEVIQEKRVQYNEKLDTLSRERPDIAGFVDGYVFAMTGTKADRNPTSAMYAQHRMYGTVAGMATIGLSLAGGRAVKIIGAGVPAAMHLGRYLKEKAEEAAKTVDSWEPEGAGFTPKPTA